MHETGIHPKYHGTGVAGEESKRKADPNFVERSYHYVSGTKPEAKLESQPFKYTSTVPKDKIYDISKDPLKLADKSKWGESLDLNLFEKNIKESGHLGYINSAHPNMSNVVALFHPVKPKERMMKNLDMLHKKLDFLEKAYKEPKGLQQERQKLQQEKQPYQTRFQKMVAAAKKQYADVRPENLEQRVKERYGLDKAAAPVVGSSTAQPIASSERVLDYSKFKKPSQEENAPTLDYSKMEPSKEMQKPRWKQLMEARGNKDRIVKNINPLQKMTKALRKAKKKWEPWMDNGD